MTRHIVRLVFDATGTCNVLSDGLNSEGPLDKTEELFFDTD